MEKIIDIEDRIPTLKERRRRRTNKKFSILLFLFVTTLLIVLYFQSSYSQIQKITLTGEKLVPKQLYIEDSTLTIGESMWSFNESKIENLVAGNAWVESVQVKREWLTTVHIQVNEFKQIGYLEDEDFLHIILENGQIIKTDGLVIPKDGPIFRDFKNEKIRLRMIKELKTLDSEVLRNISQINYTPTENDAYSIQVYMNDGNEVKAIIPSFGEKMSFYPSIVSQLNPEVKGIIDLEVGTFFQPYVDVYNVPIEEEIVENEED
ncbi:cell division protein FtsQ/DivIB [Psychrobacillus antarcticus]|uniref:cell division protein FtsQ/DivIB n=1 Tax=Psychrobacillus antarcticus TaxID=2879115 RepID=UPI002407B56F|nr:FtsQ-type POTRA domain-containing protein [Psychrobacillus antarcticus]